MMTTIFLLALAGMVIAVIVGSFWYSGATPMGRLHMRYLGFDKLSPEEQQNQMSAAKPTMWKYYAVQMALSLLTAFFVVFVIIMSVQNGLPIGVAVLFPIMGWLCFTVPAIGSAILWSNCDSAIAWKKFFSDIASILVTILLTALVVSFFV